MVACKDKGQPENIKQQIRALVGKYIKSPQTIISSNGCSFRFRN